MPDDWPAYPDHARVLQYLRDFATHFGLTPLIRFNTAVTTLERRGAGWRAGVSDGRVQDYAGVIIANGPLSDPLLPAIAGRLDGPCMHAMDSTTPNIFTVRNWICIG